MKVAVIGAGASGLTAIKCCLDEGLETDCFEKQSDFGGLWNYVPGEKDGATVYKSTVINSSKEMMCYSDFPIPKDFPNYMPHGKIMEYYRLYAEKFKLLKHIQFNTEVVSCVQDEDFKSSGKWIVTTKDTKSNEIKKGIYNGILVCVGHHAIPNYPRSSFPGIDSFKGMCCHSNSYRVPHPYVDKKVVVIGIGNSGADIAVELSHHGKQVYLSTRRGTWVFGRTGPGGLPGDYEGQRRIYATLGERFPNYFMSALRKQIGHKMGHMKLSLLPSHDILSQHPTLNDSLSDRIITGTVQIKCNVARFTENTVIFEDGSEEEVDAVVFATGYLMAYPFFSDDIMEVKDNKSELYKFVFPVNVRPHTLAIIGCIQPLGSVGPISELQSRWAARVIKGSSVLPSEEIMKKDIELKQAEMRKRYVASKRHTIQVDYMPYMDELAEQISCKPDIWTWLWKDPKLAWQMFFGPNVSYVYRVQGPNQWKGAREAIMTTHERVLYPFTTRKVNPFKEEKSNYLFYYAILVLIFLFIFKIL